MLPAGIMKFDIYVAEICRENYKFIKIGKEEMYLTLRSIYILIISRSVLLRIRNVSHKFVEKIKTHILCSVIFFFFNGSVYEIMWKNIAESDRQLITVWRMRIAYWTRKATNTHSRNGQRLLLLHCYNGCTKAPQCYVTGTLLALFLYIF